LIYFLPFLLPLPSGSKTPDFYMKLFSKNLNADAQEFDGATATEATATTKAPEVVVVETAHDDFDWSVDKRNVSHYAEAERVKYDN
jgi:small subunit ribosomal protein S1